MVSLEAHPPRQHRPFLSDDLLTHLLYYHSSMPLMGRMDFAMCVYPKRFTSIRVSPTTRGTVSDLVKLIVQRN